MYFKKVIKLFVSNPVLNSTSQVNYSNLYIFNPFETNNKFESFIMYLLSILVRLRYLIWINRRFIFVVLFGLRNHYRFIYEIHTKYIGAYLFELLKIKKDLMNLNTFSEMLWNWLFETKKMKVSNKITIHIIHTYLYLFN